MKIHRVLLHYIVIISFSDEVSQSFHNEINKQLGERIKRLDEAQKDPKPDSVEVVCQCIKKRDYLSIWELSAVRSVSEINVSFLNVLRNGM